MRSVADSRWRSDLPATEPDPVAFFDGAVAAFDAARDRCGIVTERHVRLGGHTIRLTVAGTGLPDLITRALQHLPAPPSGHPALTVLVWDDASTRTTLPWLWHANHLDRGEIHGYNTERFYAAYHHSAGILSAMDLHRNTAVFWARDAAALPASETAAPLLNIFHWFFASVGQHVVHAAAVGTPTAGVLLAGKGGSGKSTSALACLGSALKYAGDDYTLLGLDPAPFAHSLYCSAKVHADMLPRLPHVLPCLANAGGLETEKPVLFLHDRWQDQIITTVPLVAVLLPRFSGERDTRLVQATRADGLKALVLTTTTQLPRAGQTSLSFMQRLLGVLPCYRLELGTVPTQIPRVMAELIHDTERCRRNGP